VIGHQLPKRVLSFCFSFLFHIPALVLLVVLLLPSFPNLIEHLKAYLFKLFVNLEVSELAHPSLLGSFHLQPILLRDLHCQGKGFSECYLLLLE